MRILMLGGTYFIGLSIARRLRGKGRVTMVNRGSKPVGLPGIELVKCDRKDTKGLARALQGDYDVVVDVSAYEPADIRSVLNALESPPRKYIFISSAAVYNRELAPLPFEEQAPAGGDAIWGDYGRLKHECEQLLAETLPSQLYILRPPYVYGPHNYLDREQFLWARLLERQPIFVPGDGGTRTHFCFVEDIADVVEQFIDRSDLEPGAYNIGEDRFYTFTEYISLLSEVSGTTPIIRHVHDESIQARSYFPFRNHDLILNVNKITAKGYRPTTLRDGMERTYEWFRSVEGISYQPTEQETAWLR